MTYEQERDAMAKEWFTKTTYWKMGQNGFEVAFRDGFDAATEYWKNKGSGEFDEECTELSKWIGDFDNGETAPTYGDVAYWQHQQNSATIAALRAELEQLKGKNNT